MDDQVERRRRRGRRKRLLLVLVVAIASLVIPYEVLFVIPVPKQGTFTLPVCLSTGFPSPGGCGPACFGIFFPSSGGSLAISWTVDAVSPATVHVRLISNESQSAECPSAGSSVIYHATSTAGSTTVQIPPSSQQVYPPVEVDAQASGNVSVFVNMTGHYTFNQPLLAS